MYANCCFPKHPGEISALLNLVRMGGGFSVAYYQVPWAIKHGALQTLGCEAAYVISFPEYASCLIPCSPYTVLASLQDCLSSLYPRFSSLGGR